MEYKNNTLIFLVIFILLNTSFVESAVGGTDTDMLDSSDFYENTISPPSTANVHKLTHSYGMNFIYDNPSNTGKVFSSIFCSINITDEYTSTLNSENSHAKGYYRLIIHEHYSNPLGTYIFDADYRSVNGSINYHSCHIADLGNRFLLFSSGQNLDVGNAVLNNPTFSYAKLYNIDSSNPNRIVPDVLNTTKFTDPVHIFPNQNIVTYTHSSRYVSSIFISSLDSLFALFITSK